MKNIKLIIALLFITGLSACYYDNFEEINPGLGLNGCDTAGSITYASHIKAIMDSRCGTNNPACHNSNGSGGYDLSNLAGITSSIDDGRFLGSIKHDNGFSPMPKNAGSKIDNCEILIIEKWLNTGRTP